MKYIQKLILFLIVGTMPLLSQAHKPNALLSDSCQSWFTYSASSLTLSFTASSVSTRIISWDYQFGDGNSSNLQNPVHTYTASGNYEVSLFTTDSSGCTYLYSEIINVQYYEELHANFSYIVDPGNPLLFHFTDNSSGNIITWNWDFGDGTTSGLQNPSHQYQTEGQYNVCLTVYSCYDPQCGDSICKTVNAQAGQYHSLGGQVFSGLFPAWPCKIWLYRKNNNSILLMDSTMTSNIGAWYFYGMPAGRYFLKAEPIQESSNYIKYLPTYSGNKFRWNNAQEIALYDNVFNIQTELVANPELQKGYANIYGGIYFGSQNQINANPAASVPILLLDDNYQLKKFVYSDSSGAFSFTNIPYGAYKILPEYTGKNAIAYEVNLVSSSPNANNIVFTIREMSITYGLGESVAGKNTLATSLFPNPSNGIITINIDKSQNSDLKVEIYSSDSRKIKEMIIPSKKQSQTIQLDNYTPGLYYVVIRNKNGQHQTFGVLFL